MFHPLPADDDAGALPRDLLAALVDQALAAPWRVLSFPPRLEARYRAETKPERLHYQIRVGLVGLALFALFLVTDRELIPDVFGLAAILRGGSLALGLALLCLLRSRTPEWLVDAVMLIFACVSTAVVMILFAATRSADRPAYLNGIVLNIMFANICLQQRFAWVLASSAITLAIVLAGLFTGEVEPAVVHSQIGLLVSALLLTVIITHRFEWQHRRFYLFGLRETLRQDDLLRSNAQLLDLSERDGLTGVANRRAVDRHLQAAWSVASGQGARLAVIMLDVDWFKRFNDCYGHPAGDECLRAVGDAMRRNLRHPGDLVGRYGGEEFIAILSGADLDAAEAVAERMRAAVESLRIPHAAAIGADIVTASLGVASMAPTPSDQAAALLRAADSALYEAKQSGRNAVSAARCPAS